jgi:hypothetical protein
MTWTQRFRAQYQIGQAVYAPSIHTFVVSGFFHDPYIGSLYSTDGINWYGSNIGNIYVDPVTYSVTWSPSLSLFVIIGTYTEDSLIAVSSDGQTWTSSGITSSAFSYKWNAIIWADFCKKFTVLGYNNGKTMSSSDGLNWKIIGTTTSRWTDITVSDEKQIILAVSIDNIFMGSIDGTYWVPLQKNQPDFRGVWCSQIGLFVTSSGFNNTIFYSNNGIEWDSSTIPGVIQNFTWSKELGILVGCDKGNWYSANSNIWYSYDGKSWSLSEMNIKPDLYYGFNVAWSSELGLFSGHVYSSNGKNWTLGNNITNSIGNCSFASWSPELRIFVLIYSLN